MIQDPSKRLQLPVLATKGFGAILLERTAGVKGIRKGACRMSALTHRPNMVPTQLKHLDSRRCHCISHMKNALVPILVSSVMSILFPSCFVLLIRHIEIRIPWFQYVPIALTEFLKKGNKHRPAPPASSRPTGPVVTFTQGTREAPPTISTKSILRSSGSKQRFEAKESKSKDQQLRRAKGIQKPVKLGDCKIVIKVINEL